MKRLPKVDPAAFHADLDTLQLALVREHYAEFVTTSANEQWDHLPLLARLVEGEAARRRDRAIARRIQLARFPVKKTLDPFDWTWPKKINRQQVMNLFRLHFVEQVSNVVFYGGVGLGKSHLAIALGLRACEERYSVLFASAIDVVNTFAAANSLGLGVSVPIARGKVTAHLAAFARNRGEKPVFLKNFSLQLERTGLRQVIKRKLHLPCGVPPCPKIALPDVCKFVPYAG